MKENRYYFKFKFMYFIFVSGFGFFYPYFNVYMEQSLNFTGSEIGLVISLSSLIPVFASPLWGTISDKSGKYKLVLKALVLAYAGAAWLLLHVDALFFVILLATLMEVVGIGMMPMLDVLATDFCERTGKDFGRVRIAASLGWVLGSFAAGYFMTHLAFDIGFVMFWPLIGLTLISFVLAIFIPDIERIDKEEAKAQNDKVGVRSLLGNKAFVFLLVFAFLTVALSDAVIAFAGNHLVTTLGAGSDAIGWMQTIGVLPEVVFFIFASKLMTTIGFKKFYIIAVVALIIRFIVYALTSSVIVFLSIGVVSPLMGAVAVIGNFLFIKKHVAKNLTGSAFMFYAAFLMLGRAFYSLLFGVIYDHFGSFVLFKVAIVFFVTALAILIQTPHFDILDDKVGKNVDIT